METTIDAAGKWPGVTFHELARFGRLPSRTEIGFHPRMPYLTVSTNAEISPGAEKHFLKEASLTVATATGKPEQYVMVKLEAGQSMLFAGSNEPTAFVELKSIGYPADGVEKIAAALCALVASHLHVPSGRIFTVFHDVKAAMWGQGGGIFG